MSDPVLEIRNLSKYFPIQRGVFKKVVGHVKAVDGISFAVNQGKTIGIVGESGCGKSTTAKCITRLIEPSTGEVIFKMDGESTDLIKASKQKLKELRKNIQIIFQDPFSSLDNRMSVYECIAEPLRVQGIGTQKERIEEVGNLLEKVGLKWEHMHRYPHEFSGGQRQRICIARALILKPSLVVCDEPVSALDVSVQAQVLNLLADLQDDFNLTYVFIAHDLSVIENICDRVIVMYLGKIVEIADKFMVYSQPKHPYTEALLASIPIADPRVKRKKYVLEGNVPDPFNPPQGCNFHERCPYAQEKCKLAEPELTEVGKGHYSACHFNDQIELTGIEY